MIIKYFKDWKLQEFDIDSSLFNSDKQIIAKLWKLIELNKVQPQHFKFWIFDDNNNYKAVVETCYRKQLNYIKNQKFDTPKDIIQKSGIKFNWDKSISRKILLNILSDWKYSYYEKYGYVENYGLDINALIKGYKNLIKLENKKSDIYLINDWPKFNTLSKEEQLQLKHKYANLFFNWNLNISLSKYYKNLDANYDYYSEKYNNVTIDDFFSDDKKIYKEICKLNDDNLWELLKNIIEAIKSDKNIVDNLFANNMVQLTEDTICWREFGLHSGKSRNENFNGFISASLIDRFGKWFGKEYDYERCEPFILPKGFWYVPNINDNDYYPLEEGEILIWNPNLCKL